MKYCVSCRSLRVIDGKFCGACGQKTIDAYFNCPFCKAQNNVVSKFCLECGKPIQESANEHINDGIKGLESKGD